LATLDPTTDAVIERQGTKRMRFAVLVDGATTRSSACRGASPLPDDAQVGLVGMSQSIAWRSMPFAANVSSTTRPASSATLKTSLPCMTTRTPWFARA
jgi:hypothetical protein